MTSLTIRLGLLALTLAVSAPAVEAQGKDSTPPKRAAPKRGDRNRITRDEIDAAGGGVVTARDAVRLLRPQWLSPSMGRVASSNIVDETSGASQVVVYIDDVRQPDLESALITVRAAKIVEMRFLDQNRAIQMRGPGHEAGVIEVSTTDKK